MRIIQFFDGYTTSSIPIQIGISELVSFADDASFEATYSGSPKSSDVYYNTTLNKIKYYNGTQWLVSVDELDIATLQSQIDSNDFDISNLENDVSTNTTNISTNATNISTNSSDITDINNSVGAVSGIAPLDANAKVPAVNLPSYVDDVEEYADLASFPVTGETGKIYVALDNNKTYRWSGSTYVEISPSDVNSVNGQTGIVVLDNTDIGLDNVTNDAQLKRADGDFNTFTEKTEPVDDDIVLIEDSESSFTKKTVKLANLLGSGQGGINYLEKNGDADNGIGDWVADQGLIISATTDIIRGTEAFEIDPQANDGVLAYVPFTIDKIDLGTQLYITADFNITDYVDSERGLEYGIYDVTNAVDVYVSNSFFSDRNKGPSLAYFQTDTTSTSYQLQIKRSPIVDSPAATVDAEPFYIDNLRVSPREVPETQGPTEWTIAIDSTPSIISDQNEGELGISVSLTTTGFYKIYYNKSRFPSGPLIRGSIEENSNNGPWSVAHRFGSDGGGNFVIAIALSGGTAANLSVDDILYLTFKQKEKDVTAYRIATDLGNGEISFKGGAPDSSGGAYAANTPFRWTTLTDTIGFYDESTGQWTIQQDGEYDLIGRLRTTASVSRDHYVNILSDGVTTRQYINFGATNPSQILTSTLRLKRGDVVDVRCTASYGIFTTDADQWSYISFAKRGNDSPIIAPILHHKYETTEHRTGEEWIDGRPIFRRVISIESDITTNILIDTWDAGLQIIDKHKTFGTEEFVLHNLNRSGTSNRVLLTYNAVNGEVRSQDIDGDGRIEAGASFIVKYVK